MGKIRNNIPNGITMLNLVSGAVAVVLALSGHLYHASWFILLAAFFDFADGFAARSLKAKSEIGTQLDSLADVISFGLAPSIIMYVLISESHGLLLLYAGEFLLLPFIALLLALASAYRLAKFNLDPGQQDRFRGLPTPAMGLFVAALPFAQAQYPDHQSVSGFLNNTYTLVILVLLFSCLMVLKIPMIALKFKSFNWRENNSRFILLGFSALLVILFHFAGLALSILLYIFISLIENMFQTRKY